MSAYGLVRYGFSLEIGWSRLQKVMQKDTAQLDILQEVKSQFDAAIALFWMIAATTLFWSGRLLFGYSVPLFLAVAIGGTLACNLLYRVAVSGYLSCGDLLRSCVDLYRFDLLTALHLPLPAGADAERKTWDLLRSQSEFGESVDVAYEHKPKVAE